jgi:hypothetical protein
LSQNASLQITVLTRKTSVNILRGRGQSHNHVHDHDHDHAPSRNHQHDHSDLTHVQIDFSGSELETHLSNTNTVICVFHGPDIHFTDSIIDAAAKAGVKLFIPSEYSLDTANPRIRELLPPYQTRFEIQQKLKGCGMNWKAIYSGIVLEEGLKTDGALGIDVLWASVVVFPHRKETKIAVSTYGGIAQFIVRVVNEGKKKSGNEVHICTFRASLQEIVDVVEKEIEKPLDKYEGVYEGAKKEAAERMRMGFFDGGVALLGRVAVWNDDVDAWSRWKQEDVEVEGGWVASVRRVVGMVRAGEINGGGCGC